MESFHGFTFKAQFDPWANAPQNSEVQCLVQGGAGGSTVCSESVNAAETQLSPISA